MASVFRGIDLMPAAFAPCSLEVLVLVDFEGQLSDELKITAGDVIQKVQPGPEEGWLQGELDGRVGIFPRLFVQVCEIRADSHIKVHAPGVLIKQGWCVCAAFALGGLKRTPAAHCCVCYCSSFCSLDLNHNRIVAYIWIACHSIIKSAINCMVINCIKSIRWLLYPQILYLLDWIHSTTAIWANQRLVAGWLESCHGHGPHLALRPGFGDPWPRLFI